jgi:predicted DNA binding protein
MAMLENVSESTISRELKKIKKKIMKILWQFFKIILRKNRQKLFFF